MPGAAAARILSSKPHDFSKVCSNFATLPSLRHLSSASAPAPLNEAAFHEVADTTLEQLETALGPLDEHFGDDFDLNVAMGVLTLKLGAKGTYVINKQTPNRQLWWSSPISGPRRYEWNEAARTWVNTRDGRQLLADLRGELKKLTGIDVDIA